jgi:cytochrome c oxidase subunit IV
MTPILAVLQAYFGRRTSLVILGILYAGIIVSCFMVAGNLAPTAMRYLDMR